MPSGDLCRNVLFGTHDKLIEINYSAVRGIQSSSPPIIVLHQKFDAG